MSDIYLTPASISYLTQSILALAITGYFVHRVRFTLRARLAGRTLSS
ncbi:MAG: hypothetical protein U9R15_05330 [Chloroflexota bacterium]|nr:hypothetical protein [Chloroflexota bacterium]